MPAVRRKHPPGEDPMRSLVERARGGDAGALDELLRALQDDVYGLAVRMLWDPHDAEDATQEILVKVVTSLDGFRGDSSLRTWVYRVAVNHLLSTRRRRVERQGWTFERFAEDLAAGLDPTAAAAPATPAEAVLAEEVKIGCTLGKLQCLDRPQRVAYILGEVFDLPSETAAAICETTPAAYRKRLSRARAKVRAFVARHCGIVNPGAPCRCTRRADAAVRAGRVDPAAPTFVGHPTLRAAPPIAAAVAEMEDLHDAAALFRSHPHFAAADHVAHAVTRVVTTQAPKLLEGP
jgi:RNA polymerase sigma factor (sigma-70 family)